MDLGGDANSYQVHKLWNWFFSVNTDRSGTITTPELEKALVNRDGTVFNLDTVKLLMMAFDSDWSGTISFPKFIGVYNYIREWQSVYQYFDLDGLRVH
ncbi:hypothetical protein BDN72DRAFT_897289 [Pluteus cervinus]|uniref:Uncharacterized protein n=1 Tax=Pluteus cervinus TaxID=181527 RepID=A0ACD3AUG8_9AGAR|nr:hypothetical protein BDN72DRAFT_897289 [Pluteus cervinus]